jgi:hypothetical protein
VSQAHKLIKGAILDTKNIEKVNTRIMTEKLKLSWYGFCLLIVTVLLVSPEEFVLVPVGSAHWTAVGCCGGD